MTVFASARRAFSMYFSIPSEARFSYQDKHTPIPAVETYGYFLGSMWVKMNEDKFVLKIEWLRVLLYNEEKSKLKMREYMLKSILRFVFCDK